MEGPSLFLAKEQPKHFKKKEVLDVSGNSKIDQIRFKGKEVKDIFTWGKHLLFQFEGFALKVHFLLWGTFSAEVEGVSVTGDYKKARVPRLKFVFENGKIEMYNCSVRILEEADIKTIYDYSADIMSPKWDSEKAFKKIQLLPDEEIADMLLDQEIFSGVGNIIKNEVLSLAYTHPKELVKNISETKIHEIILLAQTFSMQFYEWRKIFVLKINLKIHRKGKCPHCGRKVKNEKTGKRNRWSHYCEVCQKFVGGHGI